MSKFKFVVCDQNYDEFVIESEQADSMYQPWVDAHPEFGATGMPTDVGDAVGEHWGVLIDIGQATFGTDFDVSTYTNISVA
jgi:hypothetical protein